MKKIFVLFFCIIFTLLCGCNQIDPPAVTDITDDPNKPPVRQPYPVSFDNESFSQAPATVASLSPAITEILKDIGVSSRLVGVSNYCDDEGLSALHIGSPANPDIDTIITLKPSLLITQSPLASTDVIKLSQAKVRVLQLETPKSFAYLCEQYIRLAMVFYGNIDSQAVAVDALENIDKAMTEAEKLGADFEFIILMGKQGRKYAVAGSESIAADMLSVYGENMTASEQDLLLSESELDGYKPDVVFADESLTEDEIEDIFGNTDVVFIPAKSFEAPTASLSEIIKACTAALE